MTKQYATPSGTTTLGLHRDDHDVIVLQLSGARTWSHCVPTSLEVALAGKASGSVGGETPCVDMLDARLAQEGSFEVELYDEESEIGPRACGETSLTPGTVVVLARGVAHRVFPATGDGSLHLTIGVGIGTSVSWEQALL